jgi:hypothetical protein
MTEPTGTLLLDQEAAETTIESIIAAMLEDMAKDKGETWVRSQLPIDVTVEFTVRAGDQVLCTAKAEVHVPGLVGGQLAPRKEDSDNNDELTKRWIERQDRLDALIDAHRAGGLNYSCDLNKGRFWWRRADGTPVVVASARALLSYALSDRSILMGWANSSFPPHATVSSIAGIPEHIAKCSEADAWLWARRVADASGAHFIYQAPSPQSLLFLGLWDVRTAAEGEDPFVPGLPWPHVVDVLEHMIEALDSGRDVRGLARNYGRTFVESHVHRGTAVGDRLRGIGERLAALAEREPPDVGPGLAALCNEARTLLTRTS